MTHKPVSNFESISNYHTVNTVSNLTEGIIRKIDGTTVSSVTVDEIKNGEKTGGKKKLYYLGIDIAGELRWAKIGPQSIQPLQKKYGLAPEKWENKRVVAVHAKIKDTEYIIWHAKGTI